MRKQPKKKRCTVNFASGAKRLLADSIGSQSSKVPSPNGTNPDEKMFLVLLDKSVTKLEQLIHCHPKVLLVKWPT